MTTATCPVCFREFNDPDDRMPTRYGSAESRVRTHIRQSGDEAHVAYREGNSESEVVVAEVVGRESTPFESAETRPGSVPRGTEKPRWPWQRNKKDKPDPGGHAKERAPSAGKATKRGRVPAADFLGDAYGGVGQLIARGSPYQATALAIQMNAQVAGYMLDDAVKGTVVDRVIVQPGVRAQTKYQQVSGLFEVPLLVYLMEKDPNRAPSMIPFLKNALRRSLPAYGPALKKARDDAAKVAEIAAELYPDLPAGEDPIDAMVNEMLAPLFARMAEQPIPMPEEAM